MTHTGWSIKRFVRTARRYGVIEIRGGQHTLTAEDSLLPDLATPSPLSSSQKGVCTSTDKSGAHSVKGFYAYGCQVWDGSYQRLSSPTAPISISQLPAGLRAIAQFAKFL